MINVASVNDVMGLSYADFVAFIGQSNSPPGGQRTLSDWCEMGGIDGDSKLLDLACSTGYSSRTIAVATNCVAVGLDCSEAAIRAARAFASNCVARDRLSYVIGDAAAIPFTSGSFTHVLAGGCFGFITDRDAALAECARVLVQGGRLGVATFHYCARPPSTLLDEVGAAIGYRPDAARDRAFWNAFYERHFELVEDHEHTLAIYPKTVVVDAVKTFIFEESDTLRNVATDVREACFQRLVAIRLTLNAHRQYQGFVVSMWEKL